MVLEKSPIETIEAMVSPLQMNRFTQLQTFMETNYNNVKTEWRLVNKNTAFECKFLAGSKKMCYCYFKENALEFMVIFGAKEREAFEAQRENFSAQTLAVYDCAKTYHDGKWMMFAVDESFQPNDCYALLKIKRKPNKG